MKVKNIMTLALLITSFECSAFLKELSGFLKGLGNTKNVTEAPSLCQTNKKSTHSSKTLELSEAELNILVTTALLEAGNRCRHDARDVTQLILNRVNSPSGFPNSITGVIFEKEQFESVFKLKPQDINTKEKAISTLMRDRKYKRSEAIKNYNELIADFKNESLMQNSTSFVRGYAFLKGEREIRNRHASDPLRHPGCNFFHPNTYTAPSDQLLKTRRDKAPTRIILRGSEKNNGCVSYNNNRNNFEYKNNEIGNTAKNLPGRSRSTSHD